MNAADIPPQRYEDIILALLHARAEGATLCPSEAARAVARDTDTDWRTLMAATREAACRLAAAGRIVVTQRGVPVDPLQARGPIRLRLNGA